MGNGNNDVFIWWLEEDSEVWVVVYLYSGNKFIRLCNGVVLYYVNKWLVFEMFLVYVFIGVIRLERFCFMLFCDFF